MAAPGAYRANHLAARLRAASLTGEHAHDRAREPSRFAELPDGRAISHGGLFSMAEKMAAVLAAAGVRPGDRVAVQVEKSVEAVQLYLATLLAGGVFAPFNPAYTTAEMAYFLGDCEPAVLVCAPDKTQALRPQVPDAAVFSLAADATGTLCEAAARAPHGFDALARNADDLAAILYTSGTTGHPKGAMLSHANLASNAQTLADCWRFTAADKLIHALPLFHTHGLFVAVHIALLAGSSLLFFPKFDADAIVAAMQRATVLMGVPTYYVRLLDHPGLTRQAAAGMRLFISGSAPLPVGTHRLWRAKTGHAILERYGLTETGMNTSNPLDGERRAGTVGTPLPGVEVRITDPANGARLAPGETGMIEVRGPNVFRGYWRRPAKNREEFRNDGFFITGDLGMRDARGYVTIAGRARDLIISGGYNIHPKEIETLIDGIPGVRESAVIGLPHPEFGESVAAVLVADPRSAPTAEEILAALKPKLAGFKHPRHIFFTDQLPRNAMGKVQKNRLREWYGGAG